MKNNALTILLVAALAVSALATTALAVLHVRYVARIQLLQLQVGAAERDRTKILSLANDAAEYSRRNPAVLPILDTLGLKVKGAPNAINPAPHNSVK